jgi:hypothetical protein
VFNATTNLPLIILERMSDLVNSSSATAFHHPSHSDEGLNIETCLSALHFTAA